MIDAGILTKDNYIGLAEFLFHNNALNAMRIGEYLSKGDPDIDKVRAAFAGLYRFEKDDYDEALRKYLEKFRLPGEAQQVERLLETFALGRTAHFTRRILQAEPNCFWRHGYCLFTRFFADYAQHGCTQPRH